MASNDSLDAREVRPVGRYEWEQILRRARLAGVIGASGKVGKDGKRTRGGVTGMTFMAVALTFASYANDKGCRVFPGDATVAVDLETTIKVVRTVRQWLVQVGLLTLVRGRHEDHGEEYRLTMPSDLFDQVEVLSPAGHKLAARRLRDEARGKTFGWSGGPPEGDSTADVPPVVDPVDSALSGDPADHPTDDLPENLGWSAGPATDEFGWSAGPGSGGPLDPLNDNDRTIRATDNSDSDLHTELAVVRARGPDEPNLDLPLTAAEAVARRVRGDPLPRCPVHPSMTNALRADGSPGCPFCRVGAVVDGPAEPEQPGHAWVEQQQAALAARSAEATRRRVGQSTTRPLAAAGPVAPPTPNPPPLRVVTADERAIHAPPAPDFAPVIKIRRGRLR